MLRFKSIKVNGEALDCDDGGKYGQIQVIVESVEADINNMQDQGIWESAPRRWVIDVGRI